MMLPIQSKSLGSFIVFFIYCSYSQYVLPSIQHDFTYQINETNIPKQTDSFVPGTNGYHLQLNPKVLQKSVLNFGELSAKTTRKMIRNKCLTVQAFGGSVTCGMSCCGQMGDVSEHPTSTTAWPYQLIDVLNEHFPCHKDDLVSGKHELRVNCASGYHTTTWINKLVQQDVDVINSIVNSDILIFDTSVNDINEGTGGHTDQQSMGLYIKQQTELLLRMINTINPNSSPIWIGTATRNSDGWNGKIPRGGDSTHVQMDVLRLYNIPQVSAIDGLGPFYSGESINFFAKIFRYDNSCHPGLTGHKIISHLLYNLIKGHYCAIRFPLFHEPNMPVERMNFAPQYISQSYLDLHIKIKSLTIILTDNALRQKYEQMEKSVGWTVTNDKPGKPNGYIATKVGDSFTLKITGSDLKLHLFSHRISLTMLKSYENIGILSLSMYRESSLLSTTTTTTTTNSTTSNSASLTLLLDCQWNEHVSEPEVQEIPLLKSDWLNLLDTDSMIITFVIEQAKPSRINNKIKLFSLTIF